MSSARKPLLNSPYGPANVRRISFKRLPKAIREAGISKIERQLETGTVTDLVAISEDDWHDACRRFNAVKALAELPGRQGERVSQIAKMFGATDRTVRRWLSIYRRNPDIAALLPRPKAAPDADGLGKRPWPQASQSGHRHPTAPAGSAPE